MRLTPNDIKQRDKKIAAPLVCLTAYTYRVAQLLDESCDLFLVGDSVAMVLYGMDSTVGVSLDTMICHGKAVVNGSETACVIVDMPYGTYENSPAQACENATRILRETNAQAVKLEGGEAMAPTIAAMTAQGIPVIAHIGLLPQSAALEGGYKIKGKTQMQEEQLMRDAMAVQEAGAFAVLIEGTVEPVARRLTEALSVPTIGIGASAACDGQILVTEDMLGLMPRVPKFVKEYGTMSDDIAKAGAAYAADVRARKFPSEEHYYHAPKDAATKTKVS